MKKHLKVAAALIFENGKLFATKRAESPYSYLSHKYEFPGGKIEEGEDEKDTVKRELKEELNLEVNVERLYAKTTFEYPDFIITLSLYECERLSSFTLNEHEAFTWFLPKDLDEKDWAPADAEMIQGLKRILG